MRKVFGILIVMLSFFMITVKADTTKTQIHFLNTGISDAILIKDNENFYLVDTGAKYSGDYVVNYLKKLGVENIKEVIITHYHDDHYGGLKAVIDNFKIEKLMLSPHKLKIGKEIYKDAIKKGIEVNYLDLTYELNDQNIKLRCWHPVNMEDNGRQESEINNKSVILYGEIGNRTFILPGDCETKEEKEFLKSIDIKDMYFMKAPHHGLNTSISDDFLNKINPKVVIVTCDGTTSPDEITMLKLAQKGISVLRTDILKDVVINFYNDNFSIEIN